MNASHEGAAASTTPSAFRRQPCLRRTGYALLATAVLLPLGAVSSNAAVQPVDAARGITLFPERDFLGVEGFPEAPLTINVIRDGVIVGSAHGTPLPDAETGTLLEVNHPGGVCWTGVTPDLLPGDRVEVVTNDTGVAETTEGNFSNLMDVSAEASELRDLNGVGGQDDLVIKGTATDLLTNQKLSEGLMEQRIVAPDLKDTSVGRRDIRALFTGGVADGVATTGDIAWDDPSDPFNTHWTATYTDLGADIAAIAHAGQTRVLAWERSDILDNRIGMTIFEAGELGGPGFGGCPAPASDGVTGTTPANINIAAKNAGGNLVINGISTAAASVDVVLDDQDGDTTDQLKVTATPSNPASTDTSVPLPKAQTWRASVPMGDVLAAGLAEGELTISGTFHRMIERTETQQQDTDGNPDTPAVDVQVKVRETRPLGGAEHNLLKDLVAPVAPTASPAGGQYIGTQSVTLAPEDEINDTVRYRIGAATVPAPTSVSPAAIGQITVSTSQTIKALSYDRAGNPSTLLTSAYDIATDRVPGAATVRTVTPADTAIDVTWAAPAANGGSPINGYVLRAHQNGTAVAEVTVGNVLSGRIPGLVNGSDYTVTVSASNASGEGAPSAASGTVTPAPPRQAPFSPTIGTATAVSSGANLTWTPPSFDGGSPITGYRVTAFNSSTGAQVGAVRTAAASATSLAMTGLINGTPYDFDVRAVNAIGTGDASDRSNTVVPAAPAGAPTNVVVQAGDGSAFASWVAPTNTGGADINSYQVQLRTGTVVQRTIEVFDTEADIDGLVNGTAYNVRVAAVTTAGRGALSQAVSFTPAAAFNPAPTVVSTTPASNGTGALVGANVTATFSEAVTGVDNTRFTLTPANGAAVTAAVTMNAARTVATLNPGASLVAGTVYTARLTTGITDSQGAAFAGYSWTFTTAGGTTATPGAPTIGTAVAGSATDARVSATANWTAPTNTGTSAISGYRVSAQRVDAAGNVLATTNSALLPATSRTLNMALPVAGDYRFQVRAVNGSGNGAFSATSNVVAGR